MKKCVICNNLFVARNVVQKTCSKKCQRRHASNLKLKYDHAKKKIIKKECVICGKEFKTLFAFRVTCSSICALANSGKIKKDKSIKKSTVVVQAKEEYVVVDTICPGCGKRHKKKILVTANSRVTPRYFCDDYPGCMNIEMNYCYDKYWENSNQARI